MYMKSDAIQVSVRQNTGTIVLNRPDCGNELTRSMVRQLVDILDDLYLDKKVRTIIVTGAGDDFCRGTDLAESQSCGELPEAEEQYGDEAGDLRDLMVRMLEVTKPIIAAVQGAALAAGAGLVAAADIVVAERTASIGFPDARQGLVAGLAAPLVSFRVGAGHAARLLLTSNPIDATEAHRLGLFHELVDKDQVWARAMAVAEHCAAGAPEAIQLTKRLINETLGENLSTQLSAGAVMSATARTTEAAEEGIAAYLEGREPDWG